MKGFRSFWQIAVGLSLGLLGLAWGVRGATYNFYFNNTEQGANSTATPTVRVSTDEKSKSGGKSLPAPETQPVSASASGPPSMPGTVTAKAESTTERGSRDSRHFRVSAGGVILRQDVLVGYDRRYGEESLEYYLIDDSHGANRLGGKVAFSFLPVRSVAITLHSTFLQEAPPNLEGYQSTFQDTFILGLDLEFLPLRFSLGRSEDLIEFGPALGASTFLASNMGFPAIGRFATLNFGARLNVNLGERWGITSAYRANSFYKMAEAGIAIQL